ncbi:hypothetical protein [Streptomyces sp. NPDC005283]|uniref:hypothetical protein n=1 Tax=Streptomyces sp. NPDC005283 TaxID=3156871 RepID=UPI003455B681
MGESTTRAAFRLTFTDFIPDPNDADCLRPAVTVHADRLTFEDEELVLWLAGTEVGRFPLSTIESVSPESPPGNGRREGPDELRSRYPNIGLPWSTEDEERLLALYQQGSRDFDALGEEFGRQPSAIRSRLAKLGLERL